MLNWIERRKYLKKIKVSERIRYHNTEDYEISLYRAPDNEYILRVTPEGSTLTEKTLDIIERWFKEITNDNCSKEIPHS